MPPPAARRAAPRIHRYGEAALLIDVADGPSAAGLARALAAADLPGLLEVVPGARTVLAVFADSAAAVAATPIVADLPPAPTHEAAGELVEIPTVYDGPDLAEVAALTGLRVRDVVERHAASEFVVEFVGFAPGFGYLRGLDVGLHVPRRATPRTSVPAGSVAIAGGYAAVYPRSSPGGWRLLGHTEAVLWDLRRDPPALLRPGIRVQFKPIGEIDR